MSELVEIRVTPFQAAEVNIALSEMEGADFGAVHRVSKSVFILYVTDIAQAIHTITRLRDSYEEDARHHYGPPALRARTRANSLRLLARRIVDAAGGITSLPEDAREHAERWGI